MFGRLDRGDDVADRDRHVDHLGLPRPQRLDPGQGEQRLGEAVHPLGVLGEAVEEVVARLGVVLGAALQDLDRAGDPGQRVAQLVGGVGDEVGFGELAAHLFGAVADDGEHGALVGQGAGLHRVGAVADPQRRVGGEADLGGAARGAAASPRAGGRRSSSSAAALLEKRTGPSSSTTITASVRPSKIASSLLRSAVSTPKLSFSEARIESRARARSPISSRPPRPQRRVEGARGHLAGGLGEARDAVGDRDRDQEAGEDADQHRDDQRPLVVAEEVDGEGGDQRDGGECAGQPQPHAYPSHEAVTNTKRH